MAKEILQINLNQDLTRSVQNIILSENNYEMSNLFFLYTLIAFIRQKIKEFQQPRTGGCG